MVQEKDEELDAGSDMDILLDRIQGTGSGTERKIIFLVGTPMSLHGEDGVPNAEQMTRHLLDKLESERRMRHIRSAGTKTATYQEAFGEVLRVLGPDRAKELLMEEVLLAYDRKEHRRKVVEGPGSTEEHCSEIEADELGWKVPLGTRALGRIIAEFPGRFHDLVLTTNFDPLITIALRLAHCPTTQTLLQGDGNPAQTLVRGCHVIHLHGYWYRRDALHTAIQLGQIRPMLNAYLKDLVKNYTIVVVAYGGWDDLFTSAIREVSMEQNAEPDILWAFHTRRNEGEEEKKRIRNIVRQAHDQGRVQFYSGIDCHQLFYQLLQRLRDSSSSTARRSAIAFKPIDLVPQTAVKRRTGIITDINWTWNREADAVTFGRARQVEWFHTGRSIVVEETAARADRKPNAEMVLKHICVCGALTGGRHMLMLFDDEAKPREQGRDYLTGSSIEVPSWRYDNEDSLRTCRIHYTPRHRIGGVAVLLSCPSLKIDEGIPSTSTVCASISHLIHTQALQGLWVKISAAGGIFVVKLHDDLSLTEHQVYDPRTTWDGSWQIKENHLTLRVENWELETRSASAPLECPMVALDEWGIFAATERYMGSLEKTPFLVLHAPPPAHGTA